MEHHNIGTISEVMEGLLGLLRLKFNAGVTYRVTSEGTDLLSPFEVTGIIIVDKRVDLEDYGIEISIHAQPSTHHPSDISPKGFLHVQSGITRTSGEAIFVHPELRVLNNDLEGYDIVVNYIANSFIEFARNLPKTSELLVMDYQVDFCRGQSS
jgi:hypothetical protein